MRPVLLIFLLVAVAISSSENTCPNPSYTSWLLPNKYSVRIYTNLASFSTPCITCTQLVIVVHGAARDANNYYCAMTDAAKLKHLNVNNPQDVAILAPRFMEKADSPKSGEVYFNNHWKDGFPSVVPSNPSVDSYAIIDTLVQYAQNSNLFPAVKRITVAGHSAGGQFVQRYALTTPIVKTRVPIKFVAANPSSFAFLDPRRFLPDGSFGIPTFSQPCPNYHRWKYGFAPPFPHYITSQNISNTTFISRYVSRTVTYMQGTFDVCNSNMNKSCDDTDLDKYCEAMAQGDFRLMRGVNFVRQLLIIFGKVVHKLALVPFVGHDHVGMFESPVGLGELFL